MRDMFSFEYQIEGLAEDPQLEGFLNSREGQQYFSRPK
ncbi:MAG: hypothetical protein ACI9TH_004659 [Kiritimatiellia bacterium]|jgi:hypothetical protein